MVGIILRRSGGWRKRASRGFDRHRALRYRFREQPKGGGPAMNQQLRRVCLGAVAAGVIIAGPVAAQQTSTDELKKDIQALQESLKAIQKELQEIKGMLARATPPLSGIGAVIDYGSGPTKGERTAKLTLVEFSDYQ
jgi:protein-disulfide isomerase